MPVLAVRSIRLLPLLALLALPGCGAATVPLLAATGGVMAGAARLDTAALDTFEALEGREAHAKGACQK